MRVIKIEKLAVSHKEHEALELVTKMLGGIVKECSNPVLKELALDGLNNLYAVTEFIEGVDD